jgi:hypothetical protein
LFHARPHPITITSLRLMVEASTDISLLPSTTTVEQNVTEAALDCRDSAAAEGVNRKFGRNRSLIAVIASPSKRARCRMHYQLHNE